MWYTMMTVWTVTQPCSSLVCPRKDIAISIMAVYFIVFLCCNCDVKLVMICICFAIVIQDAVRWAPRVNVQAVVLQKNEKTKNGSRQKPSLPVDEILALKWLGFFGTALSNYLVIKLKLWLWELLAMYFARLNL